MENDIGKHDEEAIALLDGIARMFGGVMVYGIDGDRLVPMYKKGRIFDSEATGALSSADRQRLVDISKKCALGGEGNRFVLLESGAVFRVSRLEGGRFLAVYEEQTADPERAENEVLKGRLEIALRNTYDMVYEINLAEDSLYRLTSGTDGVVVSKMEQSFTECAAEGADSLVREDYRDIFLKVMSREYLRSHIESSGDRVTLEVPRKCSDGEYRWFSYLVKKTEQTENSYTVFIQNIDRQKRDAMRFGHINEICKAVVSHTYRDVYVIDLRSGRYFRYCMNGAIMSELMESYNYDEKIDFLSRFIYSEDMGLWEKHIFRRNIAANLEEKQEQCVRIRLKGSSGISWREVIYRYINKEQGLVLCTVQDVTEQVLADREAEEKLRSALRCAKKASEAKSCFLNHISHDIRTPMEAIVGMTDLTLMHAGNAKMVRDGLNEINGFMKYLLSQVDNIIEFSRAESGRFNLISEPFGLRRLCSDISVIIRLQSAYNGIEYTESISDNVHEYYIGDGPHIKQILMNLVSNSLKYTPKGGSISLTVSEGEGEKGTEVCFLIADTGIGMDSKTVERMLKPFERDSERDGSGMGLTVANNLTKLMHGRLEIQSAVDKGTAARVTIPLEVTGEREKTAAPAKIDDGFIKGKRILLVEDNDVNREIVSVILRNRGFKVDTAINGEAAVKRFMSNKRGYYAVILMDIKMPVMDGLEAAKAIRSSSRADAKTQPIIALTANAFDEDVEASRAAGMNGHITKPMQPDDLLRLLQDIIK